MLGQDSLSAVHGGSAQYQVSADFNCKCYLQLHGFLLKAAGVLSHLMPCFNIHVLLPLGGSKAQAPS